ncbi:hypothetical protein Trichorick_01403 (plasmid) [Candidatus Trichorickettsia mobilis]|uniref:Uncharacterized protein n=1 Tax=Candidatus Trichorickettsia mobilis TaxID=1346319 RepID=A0ABZ0UTY6_9RICK|nr:hypothetical protein [Candidatus Trichorickettsia mobilis]WPY01490.1 hypothetical protein Trichorick_01403 [Candidatus Trichorickettsia mobilis]
MIKNKAKVNTKFVATFKNIIVDAKGQPQDALIVDIVSECGKARKSRHKVDYSVAPELFESLNSGDQIVFEAQYQERPAYAEGYQLFSIKNIKRLS